MPQVLSPALSASLAQAVYDVRLMPDVEAAVRDRLAARGLEAGDAAGRDQVEALTTEIVEDFELRTSAISGLSGFIGTRDSSGFAMVLHGKGRRRGEAAVVFRGTQTTGDWLSNANYRGSPGPFGGFVHTGFQDIYLSLEREVMARMRQGDPARLHVVGHSLGGAIAHLFAGRVVERSIAAVELYTFGAPRSGGDTFVRELTGRVGEGHMHRVQAENDPVPMVPIWPYVHAPLSGAVLKVAGVGGTISVDAHLMPHYIREVGQLDWARLAGSWSPPPVKTLPELIAEARAESSFPYSWLALKALGKALELVLLSAGVSIAAALATGVTFLDLLAKSLIRLATLGAEMAEYAVEILRIAARWIGLTLTVTARDLSIALVRFVLDLLFRAIARLARGALETVARLR